MCGGSRAWCDREGFAAIHSSDNCFSGSASSGHGSTRHTDYGIP